MTDYDYIITGSGLAGLSLITRLIATGKFEDKKILLVDKTAKTGNEKTWCFWEEENGFFEKLVHKSWSNLAFFSKTVNRTFETKPYRYKMIRSGTFYQHCLSKIQESPNITTLHGDVQKIGTENNRGFAIIDNKKYSADYIFNSIIFAPEKLTNKTSLLQHFKGWVIKTENPTFDTDTATLMDFRVNQQNGTSFVYTMPLSDKQALIEYTLFTKNLLQPAEYDKNLDDYIRNQLGIGEFTIEESEFGIIPMTGHHFRQNERNVINIGTAGGQTKASSGYTFQFTQKKTAAITKLLTEGKPPHANLHKSRFHFYDRILLNVLTKEEISGADIFSRIFEKNCPRSIFRFLDNESSLKEDIQIIKNLPLVPFSTAAIKELFA